MKVTCSAGLATDFSTATKITILPTHNITATAGTGGSISSSGVSAVCEGSAKSYTISADPCYILSDVLVDGVSQGAITSYTFSNVTLDHTINAVYTIRTYSIIVDDPSNGTITPASGAVNCGSNPVYNITASQCYHISDVFVDGVSQGPISSYTFTNVTAVHTISALFDQDPPLGLPAPLSGPINVCPYIGTPTVLTFSVPQSPWVTSYQWTIPPTLSYVGGQGTNTIQVTVGAGFIANANKQIRVRALSPCGNSGLAIYYLVAQAPGTPQPIIASTSNICPSIGTNIPVTYTIPKVTAATSYLWIAQAGTTSISHPNGPGVNDTVVTVTFTAGYSTSNLTVQSVNNCGTSAARSFSVARNNASTPGLISGATVACPFIAPNGVPGSYSISGVANATGYTWSVPAGSTGLTGQGSTDISFTYPAGFTNGTLSVAATNGCGTSGNRVLNITTLNPATPTPVDVIQVQGCPDRIYSYTLAVMPPNAVSVQWTVPSGGTIVAGQGSKSINVQYTDQTISGFVGTTAINNCGVSVTRLTSVKLPLCPPLSRGMNGADNTKQIFGATDAPAVFPNPSTSEFRVIGVPGSSEEIFIKVMDLQGRVVEQKIFESGVCVFGSNLKQGVYVIEWRQGKVKRSEKIVKF